MTNPIVKNSNLALGSHEVITLNGIKCKLYVGLGTSHVPGQKHTIYSNITLERAPQIYLSSEILFDGVQVEDDDNTEERKAVLLTEARERINIEALTLRATDNLALLTGLFADHLGLDDHPMAGCKIGC